MSATPQHPQKNRVSRRVLAATAGLVTVGALVAAMPAGAHDRGKGHGHGHQSRTVDVQLLSFNDLHGNLEPPAGSAGTVSETQADGTVTSVPAGGVEYLATSLRTARKGNPYSVTAAGGDMVGASPLLSGLFHDEPTIEALNGLDLDVTAVGNHEFDEGATELSRLQNGGCHPVEGCYEEGKKFKGADFPYLAANVTSEKTGKPILKPYTVWKKNGVKIGFIGVTLEGTPNIVTANGVKGLKFHDEIETVNKYAKELDRQGVKSIVALIHEGGAPASAVVQLRLRQPRAPVTASPGRSSTSPRASRRRSTPWSRATPTRRTSARSRTPRASRAWSPRRRRSASSTPTRPSPTTAGPTTSSVRRWSRRTTSSAGTRPRPPT